MAVATIRIQLAACLPARVHTNPDRGKGRVCRCAGRWSGYGLRAVAARPLRLPPARSAPPTSPCSKRTALLAPATSPFALYSGPRLRPTRPLGRRDLAVSRRVCAGLVRSGRQGERDRSIPASERQRSRAKHLRKNCGITLDQVARMRERQEGKCGICNVVMTPPGSESTSTCVDHCHATKRIRMLLCNHCNRMLGFARDDSTVLRRAAAYIDHRDRERRRLESFALSRARRRSQRVIRNRDERLAWQMDRAKR
jgi:Recombination endonuclease VII